MLILFKFGQLVTTDVTVQTSQSLVKQNTVKINYVSEAGFSSFKTLITWYDRWICKKYRTMQEDLPISYLLSSPCTHHMQDTNSKQIDMRTVFWVCDLKELFFSSWTPYNCQKEEQSVGSLPLNATALNLHTSMTNVKPWTEAFIFSLHAKFFHKLWRDSQVWSPHIIILSIPLG